MKSFKAFLNNLWLYFSLVVTFYCANLLFAQGAGNSILFDGSNDYIQISDAASLDISSNLTMSAWVKVNSTSYSNAGDNFDDNSIDLNKWTAFVNGNYSVEENYQNLRITLGNNSSYSIAGYISQNKFYLDGDFDIKVHIDNSGISQPTGYDWENTAFQINSTDGKYWKFWVSICCNGPNDLRYQTEASDDGHDFSSLTSTDLTVRFVRSGSTITCYGYDVNTEEYTRTFTNTTSSEPVYISMFNQSSGNFTGTTLFDDFVVSAGNVIATLAGKETNGYGISASPTKIVTQIIETYITKDVTLGTGWNHIAVTYDNSNQKLYLNGVLLSTLSQTGSIPTGAKDLFFGELLSGNLDEIRIWDVALTQAQIQEMMCKKITSSNLPTGVAWSNLKGYWRMDETSGTTAADQTANSNTGTLVNGVSWQTSGAPIGDISAYNYSSPTSVSLAHSDGDSFTVNNITGSPDGVQIYRVNEAPNVTAAPGNITQLFTSRYFGVYVIGGSSPTYTFTYNYNGNPDIGSWENYQDLAKRSNNSTTSWTEANATLNTSSKTLTLTGQTGTEYIDGKENTEQPVEIICFTAKAINEGIMLNWQTATEVNNYGFEIERSLFTATPVKTWEKIGFVEGHGNSNAPNDYTFVDTSTPLSTSLINYRLKQIDFDGAFEYSDIVKIENNLPKEYSLNQNYPNPFNPSTTISYGLPFESKVKVEIFNILGQRVDMIANGVESAGVHSTLWDAGHLASGIYIIRINATSVNGNNNFTKAIKMILMK